jgi:mRNA export factor
MLDLQSGTSQQVAQHDGAVKCVRSFNSPQGIILVTGSWDKTVKVGRSPSLLTATILITPFRAVKYWDLRQSQPISTLNLSERCYALDVVYPLMVVGCAERQIHVINLTNPTTIHKVCRSPCK